MMRDSTTIVIFSAITALLFGPNVFAIDSDSSGAESSAVIKKLVRGGSPPPVAADELGFDEIIYVKRKPYSSDHYYTDINNGTSADRFLPENGIHIYNLRTRKERAVVTAADMPGGEGIHRQDQLVVRCEKGFIRFS